MVRARFKKDRLFIVLTRSFRGGLSRLASLLKLPWQVFLETAI